MTFLEVEMALLLLAFGIVAILGVAPLSSKGVVLAERQEKAIQYAQAILENELAMSYGYLSGLVGTVRGSIVPDTPSTTDIYLPGAPKGTFSYQIACAKYPNLSNATLQQNVLVIAVEVWWYANGKTSSGSVVPTDQYVRTVKVVGYKSSALSQ